jgi:PadR family transcriptional regulator PadR
MERLEEFGFEQINSVTLYRTLRELEKQGLCKSTWETSTSGPASQVYRVTNEGEAYLTS